MIKNSKRSNNSKKGSITADSHSNSGKIISDDRFSSMHTAPIFKKVNKDSHKIKVDDRFKGVLTDDRFKSTPGSSVDKYGRAVNKKKIDNELENFYQIESEEKQQDDDDDDDEEEEEEEEDAPQVTKCMSKGKMDNETRLDYLNRLARGEVDDSDDDSDDGSDADSDNDSDGEEEENIETGEATRRLAIQNCDWKNLKAADILLVLKSFCPIGKSIHSVTIYPSDFGLQQMEKEEKFGPQGIWSSRNEHASDNEDDDEEDGDDEDEEDEEDIYNGLEKMNSDGDNNSDDEDGKSSKKDKKGDFKRKKNSVGIVLHDELVRMGKAKPDKYDRNSSSGTSSSSIKKNADGFDPVALKAYELSKLRYYFAVAVCDSIDTANIIYEQLDGVELEHSSMTFDLRFIPDDVNFNQRKVHDTCLAIPETYKAPDFIVNALQHTNIQCTWDEDDTERTSKLTNMSKWRDLNESEFQQYLASSESESEEDDDKANRMRKLLLGNDDDDDDDDDDFFEKEDSDSSVDGKKEKYSTKETKKLTAAAAATTAAGDEEGNMTFSYMPNTGKELLQRKKERSMHKHETPFEEKVRLMAEKKKERKLAKKNQPMLQQQQQQRSSDDTDDEVLDDDDPLDDDNLVGNEEEQLDFDDDELDFDAEGGRSSSKQGYAKKDGRRNKKVTLVADGSKSSYAASQAELELLLAGDDSFANDYNMKDIIRQEKTNMKKSKRSKGKSKGMDSADAGDTFTIDLQDERFKSLVQGDAKFGIDTTSSDFKETKAMRLLLSEQSANRQNNRNSGDSSSTSSGSSKGNSSIGTTASSNAYDAVGANADTSNTTNLAEKLKRKFTNHDAFPSTTVTIAGAATTTATGERKVSKKKKV